MSSPAYLYCVTNTVNGKMYVGITTKSVAHRWAAHVSAALCYGKFRFHRAILKYGPEAFEVVELHRYPSMEEASAAEIALIDQFSLVERGYNSSPGGSLFSAETCQRISDATRDKAKGGGKLTGDKLRGRKRTYRTRMNMVLGRWKAKQDREKWGF